MIKKKFSILILNLYLSGIGHWLAFPPVQKDTSLPFILYEMYRAIQKLNESHPKIYGEKWPPEYTEYTYNSVNSTQNGNLKIIKYNVHREKYIGRKYIGRRRMCDLCSKLSSELLDCWGKNITISTPSQIWLLTFDLKISSVSYYTMEPLYQVCSLTSLGLKVNWPTSQNMFLWYFFKGLH